MNLGIENFLPSSLPLRNGDTGWRGTAISLWYTLTTEILTISGRLNPRQARPYERKIYLPIYYLKYIVIYYFPFLFSNILYIRIH